MTGGLRMNSIRKLTMLTVIKNLLLLIGTTHIFDKSNSFICATLFSVTEELLLFSNVLHRHYLALSALFRLVAIVSCMGSTIVSHDAWLFAHIAEIVRLVSSHLACRGILGINLLMPNYLVLLVEGGCLFRWLHRRELLLMLLSHILNHFGVKLLIKILVLLSSNANVAASYLLLLMHLSIFWWSLVRNRFWSSLMNNRKILLKHGRLAPNHVLVHLLLLLLNQIVIELSVTQIFGGLTADQMIFLLLHVTWSRFKSALSPLNWCLTIILRNNYLVVDPHLICVILASHVLVCWQEIIQVLLLLVLLLVLSYNWSRLTIALVLLSWYESPRLILQRHIIVWWYSRWGCTNGLMGVHLMLIIIKSSIIKSSLLAYPLTVF